MWANKLRVLFNKMAGSNGTLIAMRMVRSKLRKREESNNNSRRHGNNAVHPQDGVVATTPVLTAKSADLPVAVVANGQSHLPTGLNHTAVEVPITEVTVDNDGVEMKVTASQTAASQQPLQLCIWNLPTSRSTCGTQVSLYSGDQTALMQNNHFQGEIPRECKGFRKNLRGKWKRLVQKKNPNPEMFSIPPELRPQLKQIYVY